VKNFSLSVIF